MNDLSLVPAGAGAGKTYHIQKTLGAWVEDGRVDPGRILAVTFTEAAASEMRNRIRAELMERGNTQGALALDKAYIGTIHALGQRLLTEHAFAAGRSPHSRLLSEAERDLLIRLELARCEALAPLMQDLRRFGYAFNPMKGNAEDQFRADLRATIDLIRGLGTRGASPDILAPALAALDNGYGPREVDGDALTTALHRAVTALLHAYPDSLAPQFSDKSSVARGFADNHRDLRRATDIARLVKDWSLWKKLAKLRVSNRSSKTPDGYDDLAQDVITAAEALPRHPGPLEDAKAKISALVTGAQEVLASYDAAKRDAGLIDYADMIVEAEALIAHRPEILQAVLSEIDCVVIDEFQDTNPVQFSLLWRLAKAAPFALIVGDTKQSIMGFQGADPRLSAALIDQHSSKVAPLDRNWRSDPRIMTFVNTLGQVLFPEGYDALTPQRDETGETALEAIALPGGRKDQTAECVADHISSLLTSGAQVIDKQSKSPRVASPADVAVLCNSHDKAAKLATALEAHGLPVSIRQNGWLMSRAMQAARAALGFAADPDDLYAALTWLTLGPARLGLEDALRNAADDVLTTHKALDPLHKVYADTQTSSVADSVFETIRRSGLRDWAAGLPEAKQAIADLARLEAEAEDFDSTAGNLKAAAGYHGHGVQVFLGWILNQDQKDWDRQPNPDGWSSGGIEICTWHAAKGREWPITVVAGLDKDFTERAGTLAADFASFDALENVLDGAGLSYFPAFAATETQERFEAQQQLADERAATREIYVALTRARDRLILALPPERSKPRERAVRMVDLLRDRAGLDISSAGITVCGQTFAARISEGAADVPETVPPAAHAFQEFGLPKMVPLVPRSAWRISPSTLAPSVQEPNWNIETIDLGAPVADLGTAEATARGTAWHLAFRALCQNPDAISQTIAATGLAESTVQQIKAQAEAMTHWLAEQGYDDLSFEMPLQQVRPDGSETNAIIDCLARGPKGLLILDHKSGACPDPVERMTGYAPQLLTYADLVRQAWPNVPLNGVAINWMSTGCLSVAALPALERV